MTRAKRRVLGMPVAACAVCVLVGLPIRAFAQVEPALDTDDDTLADREVACR